MTRVSGLAELQLARDGGRLSGGKGIGGTRGGVEEQ